MIVDSFFTCCFYILYCIAAVYSSALPPSNPVEYNRPDGVNEFFITNLFVDFFISHTSATIPFGFPQKIYMELFEVDELTRPLERYICWKDIDANTNLRSDIGDIPKLTCRTWGDDEYPDSSFHLTHEDFKVKAWDKMMKMREGEDETVEEPPFSINIENLTSLANFHFIFNHPEFPDQCHDEVVLTSEDWKTGLWQNGRGIVLEWKPPKHKRRPEWITPRK